MNYITYVNIPYNITLKIISSLLYFILFILMIYCAFVVIITSYIVVNSILIPTSARTGVATHSATKIE